MAANSAEYLRALGMVHFSSVHQPVSADVVQWQATIATNMHDDMPVKMEMGPDNLVTTKLECGPASISSNSDTLLHTEQFADSGTWLLKPLP